MSSQYLFEAIGTAWRIDIWDDITPAEQTDILSHVAKRIEIFDKTYSRFRADSLVTQMSEKEGTYTLPEDALDMFSLYRDLFVLTDGLVTPLIGQVLVDAGYDAVYSLKQKNPLERPSSWDDVLEYAHPHLTLRTPVLLDFGAAGKGYLVDLVEKILKENGLRNFCIDAGGDMMHCREDNVPLRVGLENPANFSQVIGVVPLSNASLCASAGSRRTWGQFHHIINPDTLTPASDVAGVWVIASTTLVADALATCLFFVPPEKISSYAFEYVILYSDNSIRQSEGFTGELFNA